MQRKGDETLYYHGATPWDGIGEEIDNNLSPSEILARAGLDWKVERRKTYYRDANGNELPAQKQVLVRSDREDMVLTEVPDKWFVTQNEELISFLAPWIDRGQMRLRAAGSIDDGRLVWIMAEVGDEAYVVKGDRNHNNILFTLPHKYGSAIDIRQTPMRMSCNNMLSLALSRTGALTVRFNHARKFNPNLIPATLNLANSQFVEYMDAMRFLASKRYTEDSLNEFVHELFPLPDGSEREISKVARLVLDHVEDQPGCELAPGTWSNVMNSVTYCTNHVMSRSRNAAMRSAIYGANRERAIDAFRLAIEFAEKS